MKMAETTVATSKSPSISPSPSTSPNTPAGRDEEATTAVINETVTDHDSFTEADEPRLMSQLASLTAAASALENVSNNPPKQGKRS